MDYRKFKADYLFTGHELLQSDHVLITDQHGKVQDIIPQSQAGDDIQVFHGLLSPGFVNCHCHLELSHLKGLIPEKTGLVDFVFTVVTQRHLPDEEIYEAIRRAEDEMIENGIVAVGDICNNTNTILQKQKQRLVYYNFVEVSGWLPQIADTRFAKSKSFYDDYINVLHESELVSISPHAPYSVSNELWNLISPYFKNKTATIHNQETSFEDALFMNGTGDFLRMYRMMNIDNSSFNPTGRSSLQSYLPKLKDAKKLLLVHNTFTKEEDIQFALNEKSEAEIFFCLCVNANQYIEQSLPPIELFRRQNCNIVLGTDSLASNHSLSILEEMKTIHQHFRSIPIAEVLQWATNNGAIALGIDNTVGSFSSDKTPGIVLIENMDGLNLIEKSSVRRII
ncbi:MAG: amidohydrolase family protein [Bacteroidetes bacterium]|nr:amidohydrolase family protein [Bacteroidota bacterium]